VSLVRETLANIPAFSKARGLVQLLCLMQLWSVLGIAFKAAHKNQHADMVPYHEVCRIHAAPMLMISYLPISKHTNFGCGGGHFLN
jgi:hypothetical protein